jgi:hypothetical protein
MIPIDIQFDAETTAFLQMYAAKRGITVKAYLDEVVRECVKEALEYERARLAFMEILKRPFNGTFPGGRPPEREELYDRPKYLFR